MLILPLFSIDIDTRDLSVMICRPTAIARVVLPSVDIDTDDEVGDEGEAEEIDDGDFLADFPDNTEVRCVSFICLKVHVIGCSCISSSSSSSFRN